MGGKPKPKGWRNRIVGTGTEAPDQLVANPRNWRMHPGPQRDALRGSLDSVGWVQQVMVNRITGHVVDGHARVEEALSRGEPSVPVLYVELDADEEALVLATLDPIGAMADQDAQKLAALLAEVGDHDAGLDDLLASFDGGYASGFANGPSGGNETIPERWAVLIDCASENEQLAMLERFVREGLRCRALLS